MGDTRERMKDGEFYCACSTTALRSEATRARDAEAALRAELEELEGRRCEMCNFWTAPDVGTGAVRGPCSLGPIPCQPRLLPAPDFGCVCWSARVVEPPPITEAEDRNGTLVRVGDEVIGGVTGTNYRIERLFADEDGTLRFADADDDRRTVSQYILWRRKQD